MRVDLLRQMPNAGDFEVISSLTYSASPFPVSTSGSGHLAGCISPGCSHVGRGGLSVAFCLDLFFALTGRADEYWKHVCVTLSLRDGIHQFTYHHLLLLCEKSREHWQ
jgi:hypothetical protein